MEMRDDVSDREKQMIHSPKLMLTFLWNPHEFHVVDAMRCQAKGEMFTAAYHIRNILTEIVAQRGVKRDERRLIVDTDNARQGHAGQK
jgi:hypothetical protein